jgi:hypothetical protein
VGGVGHGVTIQDAGRGRTCVRETQRSWLESEECVCVWAVCLCVWQ